MGLPLDSEHVSCNTPAATQTQPRVVPDAEHGAED